MKKIAFALIVIMFLSFGKSFAQKYAYVDTEYILDEEARSLKSLY